MKFSAFIFGLFFFLLHDLQLDLLRRVVPSPLFLPVPHPPPLFWHILKEINYE